MRRFIATLLLVALLPVGLLVWLVTDIYDTLDHWGEGEL